jgi:hypothetical protein
MTMRKLIPFLAVYSALGLVACGGAGMGADVRMDITARMDSAKPAIEACYKDALERNRKLKGAMVLSFVAAPKTGKFEELQILRNDLADDALAKCVLDQVGGLALAKPQDSKVSVPSYPLDFAPSN